MNMSFSQALEALKKGCWVCRKGWNGKEQHIELVTDISAVSRKGRSRMSYQGFGSKAIAFVSPKGTQIGWLASQSDLLSDDWEIVEIPTISNTCEKEMTVR